MKERPILFSAEMVRAILEERKTQTRRVVKPQCETYLGKNAGFTELRDDKSCLYEFDNPFKIIGCPYGEPGDRLWVRETWAVHWMFDPCKPSVLKPEGWMQGDSLWYRSHSEEIPLTGTCNKGQKGTWRPSIFMPRWASRINLEIIDIRVERVQDISETDLIAEGFDGYNGTWRDEERFRNLWDSINAKRGYGWAENPWVWVVEFKVIYG